jgi:hypothetical protein
MTWVVQGSGAAVPVTAMDLPELDGGESEAEGGVNHVAKHELVL